MRVPGQEPGGGPVQEGVRIASGTRRVEVGWGRARAAAKCRRCRQVAPRAVASGRALGRARSARAPGRSRRRVGQRARRARQAPQGSSPPRSGPGRRPARRPSRGERPRATPRRTRDRGSRRGRRESCRAAACASMTETLDPVGERPAGRGERSTSGARARQVRGFPLGLVHTGASLPRSAGSRRAPAPERALGDSCSQCASTSCFGSQGGHGAPSPARRSVSRTTRGACSAKRSRTTNSSAARADDRRAEAPQSIVRTSSPGRRGATPAGSEPTTAPDPAERPELEAMQRVTRDEREPSLGRAAGATVTGVQLTGRTGDGSGRGAAAKQPARSRSTAAAGPSRRSSTR